MQHLFRIGDTLEDRADDDADRQIAENCSKPQPLEDWCGDDRSGQKKQHFGE
ncbi:hypothetical protein D3C73_909830 [compost metagenome]